MKFWKQVSLISVLLRSQAMHSADMAIGQVVNVPSHITYATTNPNLLKRALDARLQSGGQQPSLGVVMQESMALLSDSSITDWYVFMFGGNSTPENGQRYGRKPIIHTDEIGDPRNRKFFWETFRNVASNPIGRNLLYRLLIEVHRKDGLEEKIAQKCSPNSDVAVIFKEAREKALDLHVEWTDTDFSIKPFNGLLCFNEKLCKIQYCRGVGGRGEYNITTGPSNINVDLFHELLHWFHSLRHPIRYFDEKFGFEP